MANKRIYRLSPLAEQDLEDSGSTLFVNGLPIRQTGITIPSSQQLKACLSAGIFHSQPIFFPATGSLRLADTSSILKNTMTIST